MFGKSVENDFLLEVIPLSQIRDGTTIATNFKILNSNCDISCKSYFHSLHVFACTIIMKAMKVTNATLKRFQIETHNFRMGYPIATC